MQPTSFTCNRCNAPLTPGVTQCPNCGQTFPGPVPYGPTAGYQQQQPVKKGLPAIAIVGIVAGVGCLPVIVIAGILFPVFSQAREKAREMSSMSNLRQIALGTVMFAQDHDQKLPPMDSMDKFKSSVGPYLQSQKGSDLFTEPGANVPYQLNGDVSNKSMASLSDPAKTVIIEESAPHSDGKIAVAYADGEVRLVMPGQTDTGASP
jgi:hypothetical protein